MPQPDDCILVVNQFALNDATQDVEIAEFGMYGQLNFDPGGDSSWQTALEDIATASIDLWKAHMRVNNFSQGARYSTCIVTRQDTAGKAKQEARAVPVAGEAWAGTGDSLPWEVSMCINLYGYRRGTFQPHNGRYRGRVYLPPLAQSTIGNLFSGKMNSTAVTAILGDFHDYLQALSLTNIGAAAQFWLPGIVSKVGNTITAPIQLSTDDRFDSQRRRERQMPVTVTSIDFP